MRLSSLLTIAAIAAIGLIALVDPALAGEPVPPPTNGRIPEPGTLGLLAAGAAGVAYMVRKRRK
jgi:hypothetical protein